MSDEIREFEDIYYRYFHGGVANEDNKKQFMPFYMQWIQSAPPGQRTSIQFSNFILNCKPYITRVRAMFLEVWTDWMDKTSFTDIVFMSFMEERAKGCVRVPIHTIEITQYIKHHALFIKKYTDIVSRLYKLVNDGDDIPDSMLEMYMTKLQADDEVYSLEALNEDILTTKSPHARSHNLLSSIKENWFTIHGVTARASDIEGILNIISDSQRNITTLVRYVHVYNNAENLQLVDSFSTIFGRDITVYEFLKYKPMNFDGNKDEWLRGMYSTHMSHFAAIKAVYSKYVALDLSEMEYLRKYLRIVDEDGYILGVITDLVSMPQYELHMKTCISDVYSGLYRSELEDADLNYMFECIKAEYIDLQSPRITEKVTALQNETNTYSSCMIKVYTEVLKRKPDHLESRHYMAIYRVDADSIKTDAALTEELYGSYEYHDVLKKRIREEFVCLYKKDPLPSQQYTLLKQALSDETTARDSVGALTELVSRFMV
jgi:hypothetical protein